MNGYAREVSYFYDPTLSILHRLVIYVLLIVTLVYLIKAYRKNNSRIIASLSLQQIHLAFIYYCLLHV